MSLSLENNDTNKFAIGEQDRDLRVGWMASELEIQLMDVIDSPNDFLRFLQLSTRKIANNQRRH